MHPDTYKEVRICSNNQGNLFVFSHKGDASYSFSKAITPTPPLPREIAIAILFSYLTGEKHHLSQALGYRVGMSVPLCMCQGEWCLPDGHSESPVLVASRRILRLRNRNSWISGSHLPTPRATSTCTGPSLAAGPGLLSSNSY